MTGWSVPLLEPELLPEPDPELPVLDDQLPLLLEPELLDVPPPLPPDEPESEPDPLPELDTDPPPDDVVASGTPASPFSVPLFVTEPPQPAGKAMAAARPASTARARREMNGSPTSPAHRQRARLSRFGTGPLSRTHVS
jgi:hypothetical protein